LEPYEAQKGHSQDDHGDHHLEKGESPGSDMEGPQHCSYPFTLGRIAHSPQA
jgi:hypothetical protein